MSVLEMMDETRVNEITIRFYRNEELDMIPCLGSFEPSLMYSLIQKECQAKQIEMTVEEEEHYEGQDFVGYMDLLFCKK